MKVLFQCDQIASPVGGGRFARGLLRKWLANFQQAQATSCDGLRLELLATQGEKPAKALEGNFKVPTVVRRFPSRLRATSFERLWAHSLPSADLIFGPFFHVCPHPRAVRVVTIHDTSFLHPEFHEDAKSARTLKIVERSLHAADLVVCISRATERCLQDRWPLLAAKTCVIYNGVDLRSATELAVLPRYPGSILSVGTIEPRKNYPVILRAFGILRERMRSDCPKLVVIGRRGWMCNAVISELLQLQESGACRWLEDASDDVLHGAYAGCRVFTYVPLMEGFGYPPFEAASHGCPMVLSQTSSVGEIWGAHAHCIDPTSVDQLVGTWQKLLEGSELERRSIALRQAECASAYSWDTCVSQYADIWRKAVLGRRRLALR
jgi:glycosyltransferase involved in cell wall biosynthesis